MRKYSEDDYLALSGIQHYAHCPRQWALIHIEGQWEENYLTASGRILHEKAHNGDLFEKRGSLITVRSLRVSSSRLGISGECDVVEFRESKNGIPLKNYEGRWTPYPVEYKRGVSKMDDCDRLQVCAQALCLEEMLCCEIKKAALFYGEPRRREVVDCTQALRESVETAIKEMHQLFERKHTPKVKTGRRCAGCSMKNLCLPKLCKKSTQNVLNYLEENIE